MLIVSISFTPDESRWKKTFMPGTGRHHDSDGRDRRSMGLVVAVSTIVGISAPDPSMKARPWLLMRTLCEKRQKRTMTLATTSPCASRRLCCSGSKQRACSYSISMPHLLDQPSIRLINPMIPLPFRVRRRRQENAGIPSHWKSSPRHCQSIRLLAGTVQHALRLRRRRSADLDLRPFRRPAYDRPYDACSRHRDTAMAKLKCGDTARCARSVRKRLADKGSSRARCRACRRRYRPGAAAAGHRSPAQAAGQNRACRAALWRAHTGRSALRSPVGALGREWKCT